MPHIAIVTGPTHVTATYSICSHELYVYIAIRHIAAIHNYINSNLHAAIGIVNIADIEYTCRTITYIAIYSFYITYMHACMH